MFVLADSFVFDFHQLFKYVLVILLALETACAMFMIKWRSGVLHFHGQTMLAVFPASTGALKCQSFTLAGGSQTDVTTESSVDWTQAAKIVIF